MERLWHKYKPTSLAKIIGQPCVAKLQAAVQDPHPACYLLEGSPGIGKTAAAEAFAFDLGCVDEFHGLQSISCSQLDMAAMRKLFRGEDNGSSVCNLRLRPMLGPGWHVLIIEELEYVHVQVQTELKVQLDTRMPSKLIVLATSNNATKLMPALVQRFKTVVFNGGDVLAEAAVDFLADVWSREYGSVPAPTWLANLGWTRDGLIREYSLRKALDKLQDIGEALMTGREVAA